MHTAMRRPIVVTDEATGGFEPSVSRGFVPVILDNPVRIPVMAGAAIARAKVGTHPKALDLGREIFDEERRGAYLHERCAAPGEQSSAHRIRPQCHPGALSA